MSIHCAPSCRPLHRSRHLHSESPCDEHSRFTALQFELRCVNHSHVTLPDPSTIIYRHLLADQLPVCLLFYFCPRTSAADRRRAQYLRRLKQQLLMATRAH